MPRSTLFRGLNVFQRTAGKFQASNKQCNNSRIEEYDQGCHLGYEDGVAWGDRRYQLTRANLDGPISKTHDMYLTSCAISPFQLYHVVSRYLEVKEARSSPGPLQGAHTLSLSLWGRRSDQHRVGVEAKTLQDLDIMPQERGVRRTFLLLNRRAN